jgi:hypothetical protein
VVYVWGAVRCDANGETMVYAVIALVLKMLLLFAQSNDPPLASLGSD